jgi:hypothetical protein
MVPKLNARQGTTIRDKGGNTYTFFFERDGRPQELCLSSFD